MSPEAIELEQLVHLEQIFYDAGYADGFAHGRIHGLIEGRALGCQTAFDIWEELGFYHAFASTWEAIYAQQPQDDARRALHHIHHLLELIRRFPTVNPSVERLPDDVDMERLQRQIRSRYKAMCASLGVRPTIRAGVGSASDDAGGGLQTTDAKYKVWTLESRPQAS